MGFVRTIKIMYSNLLNLSHGYYDRTLDQQDIYSSLFEYNFAIMHEKVVTF